MSVLVEIRKLSKVYERGAALHFQGKEGTCLAWWLVDLGTWGERSENDVLVRMLVRP